MATNIPIGKLQNGDDLYRSDKTGTLTYYRKTAIGKYQSLGTELPKGARLFSANGPKAKIRRTEDAPGTSGQVYRQAKKDLPPEEDLRSLFSNALKKRQQTVAPKKVARITISSDVANTYNIRKWQNNVARNKGVVPPDFIARCAKKKAFWPKSAKERPQQKPQKLGKKRFLQRTKQFLKINKKAEKFSENLTACEESPASPTPVVDGWQQKVSTTLRTTKIAHEAKTYNGEGSAIIRPPSIVEMTDLTSADLDILNISDFGVVPPTYDQPIFLNGMCVHCHAHGVVKNRPHNSKQCAYLKCGCIKCQIGEYSYEEYQYVNDPNPPLPQSAFQDDQQIQEHLRLYFA